MNEGQLVRVKQDQDGATDSIGLITKLWPSGRVTVTFRDGSFRSLTVANLESIDDDSLSRNPGRGSSVTGSEILGGA